MSRYTEALIKSVINKSTTKQWTEAVLEWDVFDCEEDDTLETSCICGKENLRYLFTIRNKCNGNMLFPIGSTCIKKFEREDLNELVDIREQLFKLFHALEGREFISLNSEFFSRKLLEYFYDNDVFNANEHNRYDPYNDYDFLLKMFNRRNKDEITTNQQKKINRLIKFSIIPYLQRQLNGKIHKKNEGK